MRPERQHEKYERVVAAARAIHAIPTAIVHPCDGVSLQSAVEAARINLIQAQANRYADTAALFQALGAGWWHRADLNGDDNAK